MRKFTLICICSILIFIFISCQKNTNTVSSGKPKLIIGIVVDQMAYNYVERYWNKFSPDGIKKLYTKGFVCKNTYFEHFPTYTGPGHSTIYTGCDPGLHGIVANDWFDGDQMKEVYCTDDSSYKTIGSFSTEGKMSPKNLLATTITDQLKLASNFKSKVMGIALKDRGSILTAGHFADAAYWYDGASKHWISSTYYMQDVPEWVKDFNNKNLPESYIINDWNTLLPIDQYTESTPDDNKYEKKYNGEDKPVFPHKFSELKYKGNNSLLQNSPWGNTFTKDFAVETIKNENLGKGDVTDFLSISFSSTDYVGHMFGPNSIEMEDTYLRFDKDIAELINFADDFLGMQNVLIFMTADHGNSPNPVFLNDHRIDAGTFYKKVIQDSSNQFLKRSFGLDNAVMDCINQQVYLDHEKIAAKNLQLNLIEDSLSAYLVRTVNGLERTYTGYNLYNKTNLDGFGINFYNGYYRKRSGDVFLNFRPYWLEDYTKGTSHGSPYNYDRHVPLVWYGWKVQAGETGEYNAVKDIVPTLAYILNIDVPEKSTGKAIIDLLKNIGR